MRSSKWAAKHIYFAHFALTDVENDEFYAFERYSRDALDLAGAVGSPFRVWVEDWSVSGSDSGALPMRLSASDEGVEINIALNGDKDIVLNGEGGFARKGSQPGEASYYYSMTRMPTAGVVSLNGRSHSVSGSSWLDREWSSAQLSDEHIGWDWFALQLSDGRDIMYYQLRPREGEATDFNLGTLVASDGAYSGLDTADVSIETLDHWQSPLRWRLSVALASPDSRRRSGHRDYAIRQRPRTPYPGSVLGRRGTHRGHIQRSTRKRQRLCRAHRIRRMSAPEYAINLYQ